MTKSSATRRSPAGPGRRSFPRVTSRLSRRSIDPDMVARGRRPDEPAGFEGVKRTMLWLASVFSDQRWEVHEVLGDGDVVAARMTHHGRHTGNLMGIPPTGREVAYQYVHFLRFRDGKAVEHWGVRDDMTLMRQLGVIPERQPAPVGAS